MRNRHHFAVQPRPGETRWSAVRGCAPTMANGSVGTDAAKTSEGTLRSLVRSLPRGCCMFAGLETLDHVSPSPRVCVGPIRLKSVRSRDSTRSARQNLRNRLKTLDQDAYQHRITTKLPNRFVVLFRGIFQLVSSTEGLQVVKELPPVRAGCSFAGAVSYALR